MTTDEIEVETDRDNFLGPEAAIEKGVIDKILAHWFHMFIKQYMGMGL